MANNAPSRNNPGGGNRVDSPVTKYFNVKGSGVMELYLPRTKEKVEGPAIESLTGLATLAIRFFLYGYDEKTGVSFKSTEYGLKSDVIKIYRKGRNEQRSEKAYEGQASGAIITAAKKAENLTSGAMLYCLELETGDIVRIELPGSSRSVFMAFQKFVENNYPTFDISFRETTKEDRHKAKEKAGRTVSMPDYLPVFVPSAPDMSEEVINEMAFNSCAILDEYFAELRGEKMEAKPDEMPDLDTEDSAEREKERDESKPVNGDDDLPF